MTYDALDNDIALLNVYFGESTALGESETDRIASKSIFRV